MNYRSDRVVIDRLNDVNKDIVKKSLIIAGCAAVTIASAYGTIVLGQDLLEFYNAGEELTLKTKFLVDLEEAKVSFAMMPGIISGMGAYYKSKDLIKDIQYKKSLKKELDINKNK